MKTREGIKPHRPWPASGTGLNWLGRLLTAVGFISIAVSVYSLQTNTQPGRSSAVKEAPPTAAEYEVSTIKPADTNGDLRRWIGYLPTGLSVKNMPVQMLLRNAFGLEDDRILGAPAWVKTSRFDIEAKVAESDIPMVRNMTVNQRREMLRPFLEERFGLKFHYESRTLPVYVLVTGKNGSKMKPFQPPGDPAKNGLRSTGRGHLNAQGIPMAILVSELANDVGRTVLDETKLDGKYDFTLEWQPDDALPMAASDNGLAQDSVGSSLFTAVQEQLGLKLEPRKGPISVLVIDHIEAPSPN
jgi:uncharacterized protein (TIGR03435 family)